MPARAHRLTPALLAVALAGCCVRPPSSVDAVPGGWINLDYLPGVGPRGLADAGKKPGAGAEPAPGVSRERPGPFGDNGKPGDSPRPAEPVAGLPGVGVVPGAVPDSGRGELVGGEPPSPVPVAGSETNVPAPIGLGQAIPLPAAARPTSEPLAGGSASIPSLRDLGDKVDAGGPALFGQPGLPGPAAPARGPSLGLARDASRPVATIPPSLSPASNDVPEPVSSAGFSLGELVSAGGSPGAGTLGLNDPVVAKQPSPKASLSLPDLSSGSALAGEGGPSLGLFGRSAGGTDSRGPNLRMGEPGSLASGSGNLPFLIAGREAGKPPVADRPKPIVLPETDSPSAPPTIFGELFRTPPVKPLQAVPGSEASLGFGRVSAGDIRSSPTASPSPPLVATSPVVGARASGVPVPAGDIPPASRPVTAGAGAQALHAPDLAREPSPIPTAAASKAPPAKLPPSPVASPAPLPPANSPAALEAGEDAGSRLEQLREEYAAYEREAARLRSLLRRALGLDPRPAAEEIPPAEGEVPSDGAR